MKPPNFRNLIGEKYGRLTVVSRAPSRPPLRKAFWHCLCDCGRECITSTNALTTGNTKSCGCIAREGTRYTHRQTKTRLYSIWMNMKMRCHNPRNNNYRSYGAKGVSVCDEWRNSFETFRDWALSNGYNEELTIDRINPYGNYHPDNCRWATRDEQQRNKRSDFDRRKNAT